MNKIDLMHATFGTDMQCRRCKDCKCLVPRHTVRPCPLQMHGLRIVERREQRLDKEVASMRTL